MANAPKGGPKFHSQAQRAKCMRMVTDKLITQAQFDAMERNSAPAHRLPKRIYQEAK